MTPFTAFEIADPATWQSFVEKLARQPAEKRRPDKDAPPPYEVQAAWDRLSLDDLHGAGLLACAKCYEKWREDPRRIRKPKGYVAKAVLHAFEAALLDQRRTLLPPPPPDAVSEFLSALGEVNTRAALASVQGLDALSPREQSVLWRRHEGTTQETLAREFKCDVRTIRRWEAKASDAFVHAAWAALGRLREVDGPPTSSDDTYSRYEARVLLSERLSRSGVHQRGLPRDPHHELKPLPEHRPGVRGPKASTTWYMDRLVGQIDVGRALGEQPVPVQQLLVLWHLGYSVAQIADFLGHDTEAVKLALESAETALLETLNGGPAAAEAPQCPPRSLREVAGEDRQRRPGRRRHAEPQAKSSKAAPAALQELLAEYGESVDASRPATNGWVSLRACVGCSSGRGRATVHTGTGVYHCFKCQLHGTADQLRAQLSA